MTTRFRRLIPVILALLPMVASAADQAAKKELTVSIDFPCGSAQVKEIDQKERRITLNPTPHKGRGWECWWYFKLTGITVGETITLDVGDAPWATPDQATFSIDGGKTWKHTEKGKRQAKRIVYQQKIDATEALFAWGPPFSPEDAQELVNRIARTADGKDGCHAEAFELCKSREGRATPAFRLTPKTSKEGAKPFGIVVTARQHAWESGGSWVGRGFAEFLASDDPSAASLRKSTVIYFVPVMDIDNVAIGAGGKNQEPHDHNRDWSEEPVFTAVAATQKIIRQLDKDGAFDLYMDLHNPAANDLSPFFFTGADELHKEPGITNLKAFFAESQKQITGPLAFKGTTRQSGPQYDKLWKSISGNWVSINCSPHVVALCLETSWNTPNSTAENYQTVGKQLGMTIERFLAARKK
jgi:hypothetical protein